MGILLELRELLPATDQFVTSAPGKISFDPDIIRMNMIRTKKIKKKTAYLISGNSGIAMTEVIIAFLLLTVIFGIMYNCINFASNMMKHAKDNDVAVAEYEKLTSQTFAKTASHPEPYAQAGLSAGTSASLNFRVAGTAKDLPVTVKTASKDIDVVTGENSDTRKVYIYRTD